MEPEERAVAMPQTLAQVAGGFGGGIGRCVIAADIDRQTTSRPSGWQLAAIAPRDRPRPLHTPITTKSSAKQHLPARLHPLTQLAAVAQLGRSSPRDRPRMCAA